MQAAKLFDLSGRVALVTGAASGLGLAYAEVLAANGARTVLIDKDGPGLAAAAARIAKAGGAAETVALDVTERDGLAAAIGGIAERHGRLDIAFANAGASGGPGFTVPEGELGAVERARWDEVLRLNLTSVFETIRWAAAPMKRQREGRIIVTSSIAGIGAEPMVSYAYAATKAAVNNLVRQAALELAPFQVTVNAIAPGPFLTNIAGGRLHRQPEIVRQFAATVPLGRIAQPDEIKGLALLLAAPASGFITGAVIPIDGGCTAA